MNLDQKLAHTLWRAASHHKAANDESRPMAERRDHKEQADQLDNETDELLQQIDQRDREKQHAASLDQHERTQHDETAHRALLAPNTYSKDHCLSAHLTRTQKPTASTPLADQLAYHLAERKNAMEWAQAFNLRANTCRPEYPDAKRKDLADRDDWDTYQHEQAKEVHRIRDAIRNAKKH